MMGRRTRPRDDGTAEEPKRGLSRWLFYFMGPPDLGDPNEPPLRPVRVLQNCAACGQPMDQHVIDRSHGKSLTVCPRPEAEATRPENQR